MQIINCATPRRCVETLHWSPTTYTSVSFSVLSRSVDKWWRWVWGLKGAKEGRPYPSSRARRSPVSPRRSGGKRGHRWPDRRADTHDSAARNHKAFIQSGPQYPIRLLCSPRGWCWRIDPEPASGASWPTQGSSPALVCRDGWYKTVP